MISPAVVLAGATIGAGVAVIVRALVTDTLDLSAALALLDGRAAPERTHPGPGRLDAVRNLALGVVVEAGHLDRYAHDLDLVGETPATARACFPECPSPNGPFA